MAVAAFVVVNATIRDGKEAGCYVMALDTITINNVTQPYTAALKDVNPHAELLAIANMG